jgi:hypothetical protein
MKVEGESSKQFALRYGGETVGLFDTARECAKAYQKHKVLTRAGSYSRTGPRYRVTKDGRVITVEKLLMLARAAALVPSR